MGFAPEQLSHDAFLGEKLVISQPLDGFRAATDPVLLAAACPANSGETVLDLGCGVGTAGLCLLSRVKVACWGLEVQPDYAELARHNAAQNNVSMQVVTGDLTAMPAPLRDRGFDHVITNPPFFGAGKRAPDAGRARARQEEVTLEIWIDAALRRLKPKGWLTLIHRAERLPEVISALKDRAGGIEIKPLAPRAGRAANRFILRARKGSRSVAKLHNPLILHEGLTHDVDGDSYSPEAKAILRHGNLIKF
jgi:tRNA1(Val) A37 N6-methylase TrmN6